MPALRYLRLTDRLACQGSVTVYGVLHPEDLLEAADSISVEEEDSLRFGLARVDRYGRARPIVSQFRAGRVISPVWTDDSFDEWRIGPFAQGRGLGGRITVDCVSLLKDLAERADSSAGKGWVSELSAGERIFSYEITERTASSILASYVIPNLPSWISLGTVDPTIPIPALSVDRLTPWQLAVAVRDALREMDVPCELRLRRNGLTGYDFDLVTAIGASAAVPVFHPHNALDSLMVRTDPTLQATRLLVRGGTDPDSFPGILGRARWRSGTPSGLVLPLTDPNGGSSPIAFDGQWAGQYLLRVKTGRTFLITDSDATAGTVTLEAMSTIAAGEDFEFRLDEPQTNTRMRGQLYGGPAIQATPYWVAGVDGVNKTLTVDTSFQGGGAPVLSADDQHIDWHAEIYTLVQGPDPSATADPTNNWWTLTNAVTGVQVGDIVVPCISGSRQLQTSAFYIGRVTVVDTTNKRLTVVRLFDGGDAITSSTTITNGIRVYRFLRRGHISDSVASTQKLTVPDVAGVTADQALIFIRQVDGAGERPAYIEQPTFIQADPTGYGVKTGELTREKVLGITQLIPNSWQRDWASSGNPPDQWSKSGSGTTSQEASLTRFGGFAWRFSLTAAGTGLRSPVFHLSWDPGHRTFSARAWVYFETYTGILESQFHVLQVLADGTTSAFGSDQVRVQPTSGTGNPTKVGAGSWVELKIEGITLTEYDAIYGLVLELRPTDALTPAATAAGVLDTIEAYPHAKCPPASYEFGDATILLQAGNRKLAEIGAPPVSYEMSARDLARAFPEDYSRLATTIGGNVRAVDPDYGFDVTVRLLRRDRDLLKPTATQFTLANRPTRMTALVQAGVKKPAVDPTVAIVDAAGSGGVLMKPAAASSGLQTYSSATTIPEDVEVTTPSSTTGITVQPGAKVTYVNTTTSAPSSTVGAEKVGAPPRPRGSTRLFR